MEQNNKTISIGVAAYNAEERIEKLINSLISQKETNFKISRIIIHCDSCSDNTVKISQEIINNLNGINIEVIDNKNRKGFALSSLAMMEYTTEDILVLLNDDIKIIDQEFILKLIRPLLEDNTVGLTSGYIKPLKPRTFIEEAIISSFNAYDRMRNMITDKNNQFTYDGASLAFSRSFIEKFKLPDPISDLGNFDAYAYFSCKDLGFKYIFARDAIFYHRYPATFKDYLKRVTRNHTQYHLMVRQFGDTAIESYKQPRLFFLWAMFVEFIKNPIGCLFIFFINFYIKIMAKTIGKESNLIWDVIDSSKNI